LERNKDIVSESDFLIAAPDSKKERLRSGTWATVRHARKLGKRVMILEP
jgi:predicted Rossmann fold nucleotide-binding protein DprA/Smf involved in DNA uptake